MTVAAKAGKFGTTILPFTPDVSTGFDDIKFYSCEEVNAETSKVKLTEVVTPAANVPYIIAINKTAGLTGTPITWSATNVLLKPEPIAYTSGEKYLMAGSFINQSLEGIYAVNSAGSLAKWASAPQAVASFRAYFKEIEALDNHDDIPLPGEEQQQQVVPGDVNGDGEVTSVDVTVLYNYLLNGDASYMVNGDQNGDGSITTNDVTFVYNILLGV